MMPRARIDFEDSLWPLLLIQYEGTMTNPQVAEALERRARYLERREPCAVIHDMRLANEFAPSEQRRMQTDWLKEHDAQLRQWVLGVAFVTSSVAMRLVISLTIRVKPLFVPHRAFAHLPEAAHWSATRLQQAGLKHQHILDHYGHGSSLHAP